jgi:hypothetical protein
MPPPNPPFPVARNLPFHSSGRNKPKPKVEFEMDWTWTDTAHNLGRFTGFVGYPVLLLGTSKVAFAARGYAKFTLAPLGNAD